MKRIIAVCLACIAVIAALFAIPAFAADSCAHSNFTIETIPATCTEGSKKIATCGLCGEVVFTQDAGDPATGHGNFSYVATNTCAADGVKQAICGYCGEVAYEESASATGNHSYNAVITDPTCTADGYTTYTCVVCGDSYTADTVASTGHSYSSVVTAPTCTEDGYTTYTCFACGDSYTADVVVTTGHSYSSAVTAPTCTEGGYTTYTCSVCGDSYVDSNVDALGHSYSFVVTAPDCVNGGYTTYTCTVCGYYYDDNHTEASGHTAVIDAAVPADCDDTGLTEGSHCSVCNEVIVAQNVVEALGHSYEAVVTSPTCTEGGYTTNICSVCGDNYISATTSEVGHIEVIDEAVAAGCDNTGLTEGKHCSVCNEVLMEQEVVEATGHDYQVIQTVEATCQAAGKITYQCQNSCGGYKTEDIEKLGHTEVENPGIEPTCTERGYKAGTKCSVCNEEIEKRVAIPAKGHTEVIDAAVAPTCTATGLTEGKHCSVCDEVLVAQTEVAATGHTPVDVAKQEPTCTEKGFTKGSKCDVCGEVLSEQTEVPALGHEWDEGVTVEATCTTDGSITYTCCVCGETKVDTIPAAHTPVEADKDATCTETGLTGRTVCSVCGDEVDAGQVIPTLSTDGKHHYEGGKCTICGGKKPNNPAKDNVPRTGDVTPVIAAMLLFGLATVSFTKKNVFAK